MTRSLSGVRPLLTGLVLAFAVSPAAGGAADEAFRALAVIRPGRADHAPAFAVPMLSGGTFQLADHRGRVVLVNFWATWCPPCREEMPALERLHQRFRDRGLYVVAIAVDADGPAPVAAFLREQGLTLPIGLDPRMDLAGRYGVRGLPSTLLVDRQGRLAGLVIGPRDWDSPDADRLVQALLAGE